MPFKSRVCFLQLSGSPGHKPCWFSKSDVLGAHLSDAGTLGRGA